MLGNNRFEIRNFKVPPGMLGAGSMHGPMHAAIDRNHGAGDVPGER
jgi:hypothetical protein